MRRQETDLAEASSGAKEQTTPSRLTLWLGRNFHGFLKERLHVTTHAVNSGSSMAVKQLCVFTINEFKSKSSPPG